MAREMEEKPHERTPPRWVPRFRVERRDTEADLLSLLEPAVRSVQDDVWRLVWVLCRQLDPVNRQKAR